jgi:hypothetical protein
LAQEPSRIAASAPAAARAPPKPRFAETAAERRDYTRRLTGRPAAEKPDHRHRRLLRARCERPRRRANEERDELAPPHSITSSARSSSAGDNSMASALAAESERSAQKAILGFPLRNNRGTILAWFEQAFPLCFNRLIALTGTFSQSLHIDHPDMTAPITDETSLLQGAGHNRHAGTTDT